MSRLILNLYSLLMWLAQPFMRHKLTRRARQEPGCFRNQALSLPPEN